MAERLLYSVEREYNTDMETMWNAWTDASELEAWYHPTVLEGVPGTFTSETKVGGLWTAAIDVPMNDFVAYFWGRYSVVEPNQRLVHSLSYSQDPAEFAQRDPNAPFHRIEIDFEQRATGVWVRFTQFGEMPEEQAEASKEGMESYFDSLGYHLDSK